MLRRPTCPLARAIPESALRTMSSSAGADDWLHSRGVHAGAGIAVATPSEHFGFIPEIAQNKVVPAAARLHIPHQIQKEIPLTSHVLFARRSGLDEEASQGKIARSRHQKAPSPEAHRGPRGRPPGSRLRYCLAPARAPPAECRRGRCPSQRRWWRRRHPAFQRRSRHSRELSLRWEARRDRPRNGTPSRPPDRAPARFPCASRRTRWPPPSLGDHTGPAHPGRLRARPPNRRVRAFLESTGAASRWRLGRANPRSTTSPSSKPKRCKISARTTGVAVAVHASMCGGLSSWSRRPSRK